jgi:hypothetical protein
MFDIFCEWAQRVVNKPWRSHVDVSFEVGEPCDNRSARLEIDTLSSVAEIVFWLSGDYVAEIIDIETEQTLYRASGVYMPDQRFEEVFAYFFEKLGI